MADADKGNILQHSKYTQVKVSVAPQTAAAFKAACAASGVSMAAELSRFMADYSNGLVKHKAALDYSTRRKRRAIVKRIVVELGQLKAAEERLIDNAPENLQDSPIYEIAEDYISVYEDVIGQLEDMVP
jgi:hypothetical protein